MTKQQKDLIIQMRGQKLSYSAIAEQLRISVNTVSSFCRRNALDGDCKDIGGTGFCKNCGRLIKSKKAIDPVSSVPIIADWHGGTRISIR